MSKTTVLLTLAAGVCLSQATIADEPIRSQPPTVVVDEDRPPTVVVDQEVELILSDLAQSARQSRQVMRGQTRDLMLTIARLQATRPFASGEFTALHRAYNAALRRAIQESRAFFVSGGLPPRPVPLSVSPGPGPQPSSPYIDLFRAHVTPVVVGFLDGLVATGRVDPGEHVDITQALERMIVVLGTELEFHFDQIQRAYDRLSQIVGPQLAARLIRAALW